MTSPLRQSYTTGQDGGHTLVSTTIWGGQTFTPVVVHTIDQVDIYIKKTGSPGALTISIQGVDGSNEPDGVEIGVGTIAESEVGATFAWETCILSSTAILTADVRYAIVIKSLGTPNGSNYYHIGFDNNDATYTNGDYFSSNDSGSNWNNGSDDDALFKEYGIFSRVSVTPSDKSHTKQLVAISNNQVWYESSSGTMAELTAAKNDIERYLQ